MVSAAHASRFRDAWEPDTLPRIVGLCRLCRRPMETNRPDHKGHVMASVDRVHCTSCLRHIRTTGGDPRDKKGHPAEQVPAERPEEDDPRWRDFGPCASSDPVAFDPPPSAEERVAMSGEELEALEAERRYAARKVCGPCPVREQCRQAARMKGYEGTWGGWFFHRTYWVDPRSNRRGPTIHAKAEDRKALAKRGKVA